MPRSNRILLSCIVLITILACNMPAGQTPTVPPDFISTITAQAQLLQQPPNSQPAQSANLSTPEPPIQVVFTDTPAFTPTITLTSSPSTAMITVSADTNCRSGPGKEYDNLGALLINESAEVVGKNTVTNYWIIKNPDRDGVCWLWGKYSTVNGNTTDLKEVAIPPTPTPSMPGAVKGLSADKICFFNGINYDLAGSIHWEDISNEDGYNVYANGGMFNVIARDVTTSAIPKLQINAGGSISMSVEAFNSAGKSPKRSVDIVCP